LEEIGLVDKKEPPLYTDIIKLRSIAMELKDMITRRKSFRKYLDKPVAEPILEQIRQFMNTLRPLYPHIPVAGRIVEKRQVRSLMPWKTHQLVAVYSGTQ